MSKQQGPAQVKSKFIGQPLDRVDGRLKVTGAAKYAAEFSAPNMAHAVLVQSTVTRGKVTKIDIEEAKRAAGVIDVLTHDNAPPAKRPSVPPGGQSQPLLFNEVVFSGQNVAVVIAETLEEAEHAAELVRIEYAAEPHEVNLEDQIDKAFLPGTGQRQPISKRGDVDAGLAQAAVKVDQVYKTPTEHHNPMEPHATLAIWSDDEHVTAYDATQGVSNSSRALSDVFGLEPKNAHVINPFVGGGFGCKGQAWPHLPIAALAAKAVKRPVKLALTRRQMFTSNGHRPETHQALTLGSSNVGRLSAIRAEMVNDTSRLESFVEPTGNDSALTYSCPNVSVRQQLVRLDIGAPTYMRAPGESSGSFSIETAMDELAIALNMDPIDLRLRNYAEKDERSDRPFSSKSLKECYRQAADAFGWSKRDPKVGSMREGRMLVGYGMATASYPANYWGASARATLHDDGSVLIQCGTQDLGTGTYTILTQVAADGLGIHPDKIRVEIGDTHLPPAPGSGGSNSAASTGSAVHNVSAALRDALVGLATSATGGPLNNVAPSDLVIESGRISSKKEPSKSITYVEILKAAGKKELQQEATAQAGRERGGTGTKGYTMQGFGAQFCEIHIDPDLGMMRVARWVGAFALGTVLNAKTLTSQLQGGIIWGIGMGLLEETFMDPVYGRYVNSNLAEYHVPVHKDAPPIQVILVPEEDDIVNPVGVKGAGEIGITGAAAAIGNAVYHATGKRIRELPITLDKIL
ncbi:MAG TPA: xanthine dehydrogenase family protein molybdopterin-binding subunit [Fimbriimonas sp.]|nr:xanthine dehydrogenase family protein molybdopterin-binding subunit [Fimbriimonas sp.]